MSTYVIGDIHGCFDQLQLLLSKIKFSQNNDTLWFTGDLINGGPKSTEVLRFIKGLGNQHICVLGNHDAVLLALAAKIKPAYEINTAGFDPILQAPDCAELIEWLRMRPIIHFDAKFNVLLVHAGVLPQWSLKQIQSYAKEFEDILHSDQAFSFYANLYGDQPDTWQETLTGWPRIRFIYNCFTRMRFCTADGKLDLISKNGTNEAPNGYTPWFKIPSVRPHGMKIIFGHWSALNGETGVTNAIAMDTGCVYGRSLTALRLDDWQFFSVNATA